VSLVYLGTSDFAAEILRRLAATDAHRPRLVVSPPDRRRGRGRKTSPTPVATVANELGIELVKTEATAGPETLERIRAAEADVGVVCAFGQLIREPLLSELELLNVHPSLLPRWRGAAPIERAIMAGDVETGVSIMRLTEGLDSGPVALQRSVAVGEADFGELSGRLENVGAELLIEALDRRAAGTLEWSDQDDDAATYADKIDSRERRLDPGATAIELERRVRALTPHVGAYLELDGEQRLGVVAARAEPGTLGPGEIDAGGDSIRLGTGDEVLALLEVRPAGGKSMDAGAYLRGHEPPALAPS
jgi:methionyl-tRNA formyltransferase